MFKSSLVKICYLVLIGLILAILIPAKTITAAPTLEVKITRLANDGVTVLEQRTVSYQWLRDNRPVMGDGTTHYYHQGPVFVDDPDPQTQEMLRWNPEEDQNVDTKDMGALRGTNLTVLCDLVGGMSSGDTLKVKSSDGWNRTFAYKNVYQYSSREGPMVLTWEKDGKYPDTGYTEGMRLVWFADTSTNPWGIHAFGNWDWHEAADPQYWYYYQQDGQYYPTTTGLSGQIVSELIIYSTQPPPLAANFSANITSGDAPLTVNFTDQSSGSPTSWAWDFDNNGTIDSTARNPSYTYTSAGTYSVKLTVSNAAGSDEELKVNYIVVNPPGPSSTPTPTPTPTSTSPDWDVNEDGQCNYLDIEVINQHLGETGTPGWIRADVNKDGAVDIGDLVVVGSHLTPGTGTPTPTPTPTPTQAPSISGFTPASAGKGASVTIYGSNFTGATAVNFGGTPAQSFNVNSSSLISAIVGTGASGSVSVTTSKGTATKSGFTFIQSPSITSFSPTSAKSGDTVTINGANFTNVTSVHFGNTPAASFNINSSTRITAEVGDGSSGSVKVTTQGGTATKSGFTFKNSAPAITSFSPVSGREGETIVIYGTNFTGASSVSFGGVPALSYKVKSSTMITAVLGDGASGSIRVSTPNGTVSKSGFTFISPVSPNTVASLKISPASQIVNPGDSFDISIMIEATDAMLRGANLGLSFNKDLLQCTGITEGSFFKDWAKSHGCTTLMFPSPEIDNAAGKVSIFGIAVMGQSKGGPSEGGVLCAIHMKAKPDVSGQAALTITDGKISNDSGVIIDNVNIQNGNIMVTSETDAPDPSMSSALPSQIPSLTPQKTSALSSDSQEGINTVLPNPESQQESNNSSQSIVFDLQECVDELGILKIDYQEQKASPKNNEYIARLDIMRGTQALDKEGNAVKSISLKQTSLPDNMEGKQLVIAAFECLPEGSTFSHPISLTIKYDPSAVPQGTPEDDLVIAYYDVQKDDWVKLYSQVDTVNHVITAQISHFTLFAIMLNDTPVISWSIFFTITGAIIAILICIAFYLLRRRRIRALANAEAVDGVFPALDPSSGTTGGLDISDKNENGLELIQSVEIDKEQNDCDVVELTFEQTNDSLINELPVKITLKHDATSGSKKTVTIRILRRLKNS